MVDDTAKAWAVYEGTGEETMNEVAKRDNVTDLAQSPEKMIEVMRNSLYPGAQPESVAMVLEYCRAAHLDPMQKPVHIVPMWIKDAQTGKGSMRDVVMPGIGLYRIQAARSGQYAGMSEPEFGEEMESEFRNENGQAANFRHPSWCKVTVYRRLQDGQIVGFTAREFWTENYAAEKRASEMPNTMWRKRKYGQLAKCTEAQALRKAFPEFGSAPTAEEMEGKEYVDAEVIGSVERQETRRPRLGRDAAEKAEQDVDQERRAQMVADLEVVCEQGSLALEKAWKALTKEDRTTVGSAGLESLKALAAQHDPEAS